MAQRQLYLPHQPLSPAELSAARLDGELVRLGTGYAAAGAAETPALRASGLAELLGDQLAAAGITAAWVHGAATAPPPVHVQRAVDRRITRPSGAQLRYSDAQLPAEDVQLIAGVRVTTPVRTLIELTRRADPGPAELRGALALAEDPAVRDAAAQRLRATRRVPHTHRALAFLERCRTEAASGPEADPIRRS